MDMQGSEWVLQGACRGVNPETLFFGSPQAQRRARGICRSCPVWQQCRAEALDNRIEFGVWGGMTERERRRVVRARRAREEVEA